MKKYYKRVSKVGMFHATFYCVYDKMPEDMPECFKRSRLVCFDRASLYKGLNTDIEADYEYHSLTGQTDMEKKLRFFVPCTEEEFNKAVYEVKEIENLFNTIKKTYENI